MTVFIAHLNKEMENGTEKFQIDLLLRLGFLLKWNYISSITGLTVLQSELYISDSFIRNIFCPCKNILDVDETKFWYQKKN